MHTLAYFTTGRNRTHPSRPWIPCVMFDRLVDEHHGQSTASLQKSPVWAGRVAISDGVTCSASPEFLQLYAV